MISSEIRVFISTRRKELKTLHHKENKNRKEAERIQTADMPRTGSLGATLHSIGLGYSGAGSHAKWNYSTTPGSAYGASTEPSYRTEMTSRGMKVITSMGNGEEYTTFIPNDEIESSGLTEAKAMKLLRGLRF